MTENNEHKIVKEAQRIINDYVNTIEGVYTKSKKRRLKKFAAATICIFCLILAALVTFIKI